MIEVTRQGKKTFMGNYTEICRLLNRDIEHIKKFICTELGTDASVDASGRLAILGRITQSRIEQLISKYVQNYVRCPICKSIETKLEKRNGLLFIKCNHCSSETSISRIKEGYKANLKKRSLRQEE